jgi:nucleoside-diphosphate-sugar epimerase
MTMRVLVTGSSGLIGSAVAQHLQDEGDDVVCFDIADGHDILDAPGVAAAAGGCDAIVHAAGGHADTDDPGARYITTTSPATGTSWPPHGRPA